MFESGEWKDTPNPEKAFYNHFAINSYESIELSSISWINRMPGFSDLSKKKTTFDILNKFRRFHPKIFNFYPRTFMLPEETDEYSDYHETHRKKTFVSKIDSGSQGFGIRILQKPADLPQLFGNSNMDEKVVQEYIDNPLQLQGKKHDLRIYVGVVSWDPQIAYINEEGLARFCTENYANTTSDNKLNENMHFSNYSLNKHSDKYVYCEELHELHNGSKRTLESYFKELASLGHDRDSIWKDIIKLCNGVLKAFKYYLQYSCRVAFSNQEKSAKAFHVLGIDVLLDTNMKPWLLEINDNPSQNITFDPEDFMKHNHKQKAMISPIDRYVKVKVLGDLVGLLWNFKKDKIQRGDVEGYRSWELIISEKLEKTEFGAVNEFENLLRMYTSLCGGKFCDKLTSTKFAKCAGWLKGIGSRKIDRLDCDIVQKKYQNFFGGQMDFDGFVYGVYHQIDKASGCGVRECPEMQRCLYNVYSNFLSKPI